MLAFYGTLLVVLAVVFGAAVASFLHLIFDRVPRGESITVPASHCPVCQHRLWAYDLIPVLSWLLLAGRCRYCKAPIPRISLLVEVLGGIAGGVATIPFLLGH